MDTPDRINARLDEETQQQLRYLMQTTGGSISLVVRDSVAHYYAQVRRERAPSRLLGLAGAWRSAAPAKERGGATGTGPSTRITTNTRTDPKAAVQAALRAKYPQHMGVQPTRPSAAGSGTGTSTGTRGRKR